MAKKKETPKKAQKVVLTTQQIKQLANSLLDTTTNIYTLCEQKFGVKVDDAFFDRLKKEGEIFHCQDCSVWRAIDTESETTDQCLDCYEEQVQGETEDLDDEEEEEEEEEEDDEE